MSSNLIEIKNLHKSFENQEVLKGVNLEVNKGDVISIIGPSGCGKSTFLRCINLLELPSGGEIVFENEVIFCNKSYELVNKLKNLTKEEFQTIFRRSAIKRAKYEGLMRNITSLDPTLFE